VTALTATQLRVAVLAVCEAVIDARDELGRLDAQAGDGDLGATLSTGFSSVRDRLDAEEPPDPRAVLLLVAGELGRRAPSTMGSLLSSSFRRAAGRVRGLSEIGPDDVAGMLEAMAEDVHEVGGASEGQRSVLDAMGPAARAAREVADAGGSVQLAAGAAARAAEAGASATAGMTAEVGRAAWIGSRVLGVKDGGATAFAVILHAFAAGLASETADT
jgi:dihydroxyacetone kinase